MRARRPAGFSLLEVLVATAILAIVFAYVSGAFIQGGLLMSKAPRMTQAALALRGVVLDLEEEFRKEGFAENDVTNRTCELPDAAEDEGFECEYDLEKMDLDQGALGEMAQAVLEEILAQVGEDGDPLKGFPIFAFLLLEASGMGVAPTCPALPSQLLQMCGIDQQKIIANILQTPLFFPMLITMAAERTRKLRVRIQHKAWGDEPVIGMETYVISLPEVAEALSEELPGTQPPPDGPKTPPPPPPPPPEH